MKTPTKQVKTLALFAFLCVLSNLWFGVNVYPQSSATQIEALLRQKAVTYAQATRYILDASNLLITPNNEEAYRYAQERNMIQGRTAPNMIVSDEQLIFYINRVFTVQEPVLIERDTGAREHELNISKSRAEVVAGYMATPLSTAPTFCRVLQCYSNHFYNFTQI